MSKLASLILVIAIITPTLVKSYHGLENHKHEICNEKYSTHFHKLDLDCEFYKFKLNNTYYISKVLNKAVYIPLNTNTELSYYFFLRTHQQDSSYLRGPPNLA